MAPGARDLWFYCSTPVTGTHSPFLADAAPAIKRISKKRDVAIPSGGVEHPRFVGCEVIGFAKEVKNAPRIAFSCQCGEAVFLLAIHTFFRNWAGLAMTAPGRDCALRGCDLVSVKVRDISHGDQIASRAVVMQHKTQRPVQFEITQATRDALQKWIKQVGLKSEDSCSRVELTTRRIESGGSICGWQAARRRRLCSVPSCALTAAVRRLELAEPA